MLIAASSISGAPGVSSWSLLLGAAWPGDDLRNRIFVEADTSGGVLAVRYGLSPTPGIVELISNVRQGVVLLETLEASGHRLGEKLWAVPSLGSADAVWPVLFRMGELGSVLSSGDDVWFVDCGRWWPTTPNVGVTSEADLNLIFVDAADSSLLSVRSRVNHFRQFGPVGVVVVGTTRRTLEELEQNFAADKVWKIPYVKQLDLLAGQAATTTKKVRRSKGWRYALSVSSDLRDLLSQFGENTSTSNFGVAQVQSVEPPVPVQSVEPPVPIQPDQGQGQPENTDRLNGSQRLTNGIVSGTGEVPIDLRNRKLGRRNGLRVRTIQSPTTCLPPKHMMVPSKTSRHRVKSQLPTIHQQHCLQGRVSRQPPIQQYRATRRIFSQRR